MQWNEELFQRKHPDYSNYCFGKKVDFIIKDDENNELHAGEFKKTKVSKSVITNQQVKNLRDNAAIMIESKKVTKDKNIGINGIDYIGDTGYLYQLDTFEDVIIASPISILVTPSNLATLKIFDETLNALYYLKSKLVELSNDIKAGKAKEKMSFALVDIFDVRGEEDNESEYDESNVFYAPKLKKCKPNKKG
ncbi:unnamed protein product [Rhizopus stolonifer]